MSSRGATCCVNSAFEVSICEMIEKYTPPRLCRAVRKRTSFQTFPLSIQQVIVPLAMSVQAYRLRNYANKCSLVRGDQFHSEFRSKLSRPFTR